MTWLRSRENGSALWRIKLERMGKVRIFRHVESHGKFVLFEGAGHATLYRDNPSLYQETLLGLICR